MKLIIIFLFASSYSVFSQSESSRWEKAEYLYRIDDSKHNKNISFDSENPFELITKSFVYGYRLLISDIDGDNCPFHPSCSSFLLDAVEETNIITGTLLFFDRFTRDASFIGRNTRYPVHKSGKLYDPAYQYVFNLKSHLPISKKNIDEE